MVERQLVRVADVEEAMSGRSAGGAAARGFVLAVGIAVSAGLSAWLIGRAVVAVSGDKNGPWILGRAAGVTSYVLLMLLVGLGLVLSHPWRTRFSRPSAATRIRLHVSLAVFTLAFVVLHIVVLAADSYAGVGVKGALVPMAATYRPLPVTLGVLGVYAGLLAGGTAALAGRIASRVWWPIHKVAAISFVLVWVHGLLAGSDTRPLMALYVVTGGAIVVLAMSRYVARTPGDMVHELTGSRR